MELLLDITATAGRLVGTVRCRQGADGAARTAVAFSGRLELLACIERLCPDDSGRGQPAAPSASTNRDS